jgi:hypothetical protein
MHVELGKQLDPEIVKDQILRHFSEVFDAKVV